MFVNFDILWRYFAWFNQTLSVFTLWAITVWLARRSVREGADKYAFLVGLVPALWMTLVCTTYIFIAPEGFQFTHTLSYLLGGSITVVLLAYFVWWFGKIQKGIR